MNIEIEYVKKGQTSVVEVQGGKASAENILRDIRLNKKGEVVRMTLKGK